MLHATYHLNRIQITLCAIFEKQLTAKENHLDMCVGPEMTIVPRMQIDRNSHSKSILKFVLDGATSDFLISVQIRIWTFFGFAEFIFGVDFSITFFFAASFARQILHFLHTNAKFIAGT